MATLILTPNEEPVLRVVEELISEYLTLGLAPYLVIHAGPRLDPGPR